MVNKHPDLKKRFIILTAFFNSRLGYAYCLIDKNIHFNFYFHKHKLDHKKYFILEIVFYIK